jgi:hypothetical protein
MIATTLYGRAMTRAVALVCHWLRDDASVGPSLQPSTVDRLSLHPETTRPFSQRVRLSLEGDRAVAPHIVLLLKACSPSAVLWSIGAIVVDAVKRVSRRRSRPHIGVERREVVRPSVAHRDAASAIGCPSIGVVCAWILAALFHAPPDAVFGGRRAVMGSTPASTTRHTAVSQARTFSYDECATVASTRPEGSAATNGHRYGRSLNNREFPEPKASDVNQLG